MALPQPGESLPEMRRLVTRDDIKAYAEASGDHNPLHQDDEVARRAGFDGVIAHGMFTMGHMASCCVAWAPSGAEVLEISAQFRSPVSMGETLVAGGEVRSVDAEAGTITLDMWVKVERDEAVEWPIKRGSAVLRLNAGQ